MKVLVAEDDKLLGQAYKLKLSKAGLDVKVVSDGSELIKALESLTPDIIILDLIMPKMDGFAVLTELKKNPAWDKIPVIVSSNLGQSDDIVKATKLGADEYIVKTDLSIGELVDKINKLIHAKKTP